MPPLNAINLNLSGISFFGGLILITAVLTWWLIRKRLKSWWFPILRVIEIDSKKLPKLQWKKPPMIPFAAFFIAGFGLIFLLLKPAVLVEVKNKSGQLNQHIFVDLSPSMQSQYSLDELKEQISSLWNSIRDRGVVNLSSSSNPNFLHVETKQDLEGFLSKLRFHPEGLKLGSWFRQYGQLYSEVDELFIASDRNLHTWSDFNWQAQAMEKQVYIYDKKPNLNKNNLFISQAAYLSAVTSQRMAWDVEVSKSGPANQPISGTLSAKIGDITLQSVDFSIAPEQSRTIVSINWLEKRVRSAISRNRKSSMAPLVFMIESTDDAIELDNEFRVFLVGVKKNAVLISEPQGELPLESPEYFLHKALDILDFRIVRRDTITPPSADLLEYPYWFIYASSHRPIDRYCPTNLIKLRSQYNELTTKHAPKVWLIPQSVTPSFPNLCHCFARLAIADAPKFRPKYCDEAQTKDQYYAVIKGIGGKQVGGNIGASAMANLAKQWHRYGNDGVTL